MSISCLVMDHDDTLVNSTATVHFPCFVEYTQKYFPDYHCTLEHYFLKNFDPGVVPFFRDEVGMNAEQMKHEEKFWNAYVQRHVPKAYPGIREILLEQRKRGGYVCVVSHSLKDNILRDFKENDLPLPDLVFGWDEPPAERKPSPHALYQIMERLKVKPEEMLVVDDLKPGYDMALAAGVPFAAAGWANDIPEIEAFMRKNCGLYFKTIEELKAYLFA